MSRICVKNADARAYTRRYILQAFQCGPGDQVHPAENLNLSFICIGPPISSSVRTQGVMDAKALAAKKFIGSRISSMLLSNTQ